MTKRDRFHVVADRAFGFAKSEHGGFAGFFSPSFPNCAGFHALVQKKKLYHPEETFTKPTLDDLQGAR